MSKNVLSDVFMMGVEKETYEEMLKIAKKKNKSVAEVASDAIKEHLISEKELNETTEKRILNG